MKRLKKIVASALTVSFAVSMLTPVNAALDPSVWEARDKEGIKARFAMFSDYHLLNDASRLEIALDAFTNIGGIDGIMQIGDQIYMNQANVLMPELYEGINMVFEGYEDLAEVPNAIIMGNHEFPLSATDTELCAEAREMFVEGLGINEDRIGIVDLHTEEDGVPYADAVYDMAGYTVVAVSSMNYLNTISPQSEAWAKEQIEAALAEDPNKPVFYLQHQCFPNTVRHYAGNKKTNSDEFVAWMMSQPRVINFSAHEHYSSWEPRSIYQSEAGYSAYSSTILGGGYLAFQEADYERSNIVDAAYANLIEVDENEVVRIYRMDLYNGEYIGDPIVFDPNDLRYTDARYENPSKPYFPDGSEIRIDSVSSAYVTGTFTSNAVNDETEAGRTHDGFVYYYRVEAINKDTGEVKAVKKIQGEYWTKNPIEKRTFTLSGLVKNTEYEIRVTPVSPLLADGTPISIDVKTTNAKSDYERQNAATKYLNVAANKPVIIGGETYSSSALTNGRKVEYDYISKTDGEAIVDLQKRYIAQSIELYDRYDKEIATSRENFVIEGSNDMETWESIAGMEAADESVFAHQGAFICNGNGKAYRYIKIRKTDEADWAYSEIRVYATQDVTAVTVNKTAFADDYYSDSLGTPDKAVNGSIANEADAWVSEKIDGSYHFLTVDMDLEQHIGLIEMLPRINTKEHHRELWQIYGSKTVAEDNSVLTEAIDLDASTGYDKLYEIGTAESFRENEFPYADEPIGLQQVVSDTETYRYLTFKRGGDDEANKSSTYLGEATGYVLNPMVNTVTEENGVIRVEFSDVMKADTINSENIKVYDGITNEILNANFVLSDDGYTAVADLGSDIGFIRVIVSEVIENQYGNYLLNDVEFFLSPQNNYRDAETKKDIYVNVAMNKPVSVSGLAPYSSYPKEFVNDDFVGNQALLDGKWGTSIGTGKGYLQIDLLNRYNLEKIQVLIRDDAYALAQDCYVTNMRILVSNDEDFAEYDVLDEVSGDEKLSSRNWTIDLDGTKDYRYLRVEKTLASGEWGFAEIRAFAKFDGILVTEGATADSYYYWGKGEEYAESYNAQRVLDGNLNSFIWVSTDVKPDNKYTALQIDLKRPCRVGYAELVARNDLYTGERYYQHFDLYGSNTGDVVVDETAETHPYLNLDNLENIAGFKRLYMTGTMYGLNAEKDIIWGREKGAVLGLALDDSTSYQYITHKTNSTLVGIELSEVRLYSIAQKVNNVEVGAKGKVTINFSGKLMSESVADGAIKLTDASGNPIKISGIEVDDYSYSFYPESSGTFVLSASQDIMNTYAIPMVETYEEEITVDLSATPVPTATPKPTDPPIEETPTPTPTVKPESECEVTYMTFKADGIQATELKAKTEYTFTAKLKNDAKTEVKAIVAIYDADGRLIAIKQGTTTDTEVSVVVATGEDVTGQTIYAYIWENDMDPVCDKVDVLKLTAISNVEMANKELSDVNQIVQIDVK